MSKTLLVLRYEMGTAFKSKSFLFTAFAMPILAAVIFGVVSLIKGGDAADSSGGLDSAVSDGPKIQLEGYVDLAGFVNEIPENVPAGTLLAYADEASAQEALNAGEIEAYYLVPADYLATGELLYIFPEYRFGADNAQDWVMRQTIFANLLGNDVERMERAGMVMNVQERMVASEQNQRNIEEDSPLAFVVPYAIMMIFYLVIIMSASLLLNSVSNEKKNRTIEVLLMSANSQQILTGKIVGLGLLGLLQMSIWLATGYGLFQLSGRTFDLPVGVELPISLLTWGIVYFLLGYAIYASLMAGLGALVPNLKEASQAVIVVIWPLIIPMMFLAALIEAPNGLFAVITSLFPLTAPVAMMTRMASVVIPWWQLLLSVVLMIATAVFIVRAIARMFHAQTLLSGQPFSAKRFFTALLGR